MALMSLSGHQIKLSQPSSLLISNHMQSKTPLQFTINALPISKIIEEIPESMLALPGFNPVPKNFSIVLV